MRLTLESLAVGDLSDINLTVEPGEIVSLSGPSGSGKSRLLRAVADIEAHGGEVRLGDTGQSDIPAHAWRRRVMLVPAESHWWADTVGPHFDTPPTPHDLNSLGLDAGVMAWSVSRLSSGEKQRLALLRAMDRAPSALLLDEPTANLDEQSTLKAEQWLTGLARTRHWPVLWVAHDSRQIDRVADRHLCIRDRTLVQAGEMR